MFDYVKNRLSSAVNELGQAMAGDDERTQMLERRITELELELERKRACLEAKQKRKLELLTPARVAPGYSPEAYRGLDPINFIESSEQSWLTSVADSIVDNFPGGEGLLSQLDATLLTLSEANHFRVSPGGPYAELLDARDRLCRLFDLAHEIPVFLSGDGLSELRGYARPFLVLDRSFLAILEAREREALLATLLGQLLFSEHKLFAFHRLMDVLDKLPSVGTLVQKSLGMLPAVGNTIARGFELARSVNEKLIRKSNLVLGLQNQLRCDRLALLSQDDPRVLTSLFTKLCFGADAGDHASLESQLLSQGERVESLLRSSVDMNMLAILAPRSHFAALRCFRLRAWRSRAQVEQLKQGRYITRDDVAAFSKRHKQLEKGLEAEHTRVYELEVELDKLRVKLERAREPSEESRETPASAPPSAG